MKVLVSADDQIRVLGDSGNPFPLEDEEGGFAEMLPCLVLSHSPSVRVSDRSTLRGHASWGNSPSGGTR